MCVVFRQVLVLRSQNHKNPIDVRSAHLNCYKRTKALRHGNSIAQASTRRSIELNFVSSLLFFHSTYVMCETCDGMCAVRHAWSMWMCLSWCAYATLLLLLLLLLPLESKRHGDGRVTTSAVAANVCTLYCVWEFPPRIHRRRLECDRRYNNIHVSIQHFFRWTTAFHCIHKQVFFHVPGSDFFGNVIHAIYLKKENENATIPWKII